MAHDLTLNRKPENKVVPWWAEEDNYSACPICGARTNDFVCQPCFDWVWDRSIADALDLESNPKILEAYARKFERLAQSGVNPRKVI